MKKSKTIRKFKKNFVPKATIIALILLVIFGGILKERLIDNKNKSTGVQTEFSLQNIPEFTDDPYVVVNNNVPYQEDYQNINFDNPESYEIYSDLDDLGRCGPAESVIGKDLMPTEERESISSVKPTGWINVKYDFVDGKYLYNRCHLIGFQLTGENANKRNLITGTRYFNVEGMLPFENMVADYIKETNKHVFYRVTPVFFEDELVARGVLMEAYSVEDKGESICFNVYCYNNQPGVNINYLTGESSIK